MRPLRLFDHVCARLRRGPASMQSLARWCDVSVQFMTRLLEAWRREHKLRRVGKAYALPRNPFSPANRITIGRGARWNIRHA